MEFPKIIFRMVKYIIVTGGVLSGLGKGVTAASIGHLLSYDYKVVPIKCDGYLNTDPGTMNPIEHGEVFVLDDGTEVDMDFGHYERFLNTTCTGRQNLTMGKVFNEIRKKERRGDYLGKTVQFVPHAVEHIISWWKEETKDTDVALIELGGTVGDMEIQLYLEAARRLRQECGAHNCMFVHLTYVPIPGGVNEQKSKPTQQSTSLLMQRGILPDMVVCRSTEYVSEEIRKKIAVFCNVAEHSVISAPDVSNVYSLPILFDDQRIVQIINAKLGLLAKPNLRDWKQQLQPPTKKATIAICGKYTALEDSYASVVEALHHAGASEQAHIDVKWIDTEQLEQKEMKKELNGIDGVIVPGGFGSRGVEGKINVIRYCRENNVPYLGICYGLQLAIIEYARNVLNKKDANTTEINKDTSMPVVDILPDKKNEENLGGTLRLGAYPAELKEGSLVMELYGKKNVSERHRHRYEVNPLYHKELCGGPLTCSGMSPDGRLVEFIEIKNHPYFVATQAHPELKSKLTKPAPLFTGLIQAVLRAQ